MEQFRLFTVVAASISIVISVFENILPTEKYQNQLRLLFGTVMLICIIKPLAVGEFSFSNLGEDIQVYKEYPETKSVETDEYLKLSIENNISREIGLKLDQNKILYDKIKTSINISENFCISITSIEITSDQTSSEEIIANVLKDSVGNAEIKIIGSVNDDKIQ